MPTSLEFNGVPIEARPGETLVQAARRHGAHVWFVCDGRGICQTCECRVSEGAANLTEPSDLERLAMREARRDKGYRLGCQARIAGSGPVSVESTAEALRLRMRELRSGAAGLTLSARVLGLGLETLSATAELMAGVAVAAPFAIPQLLRQPPTPARVAAYARDTLRLAQMLWTGAQSTPVRRP